MTLDQVKDNINAYIQWTHTSTERTPEAYIQYLARESALEKLESAINILDTATRALDDIEHLITDGEDENAIYAEIGTLMNDLATLRGNADV